MTIIFVDPDKTLQEKFEETFRQTNKVVCFDDMYDAYLWTKKYTKAPDVILVEVELNSPAGLQTLKFLESKSKLAFTNLVAFTTEKFTEAQKRFAISEGADAIFEKDKLFSELSSYLKFLNADRAATAKSSKKYSGKK